MNSAVTIERAAAEDAVGIVRLLESHHLPLEGLSPHLASTLVARREGAVIGCAALEVYGEDALLRSVAVANVERGHGLGHALTQAAVDLAQKRGVRALYLLTTTADGFFPKFSFERITRADVPVALLASVEFTSAWPSSATVMRTRL